MELIYFPKSIVEIFRIFALYNIPEDYYDKNIETISYSYNENIGQKMVHIRYWKQGKTLPGTTEHRVYMIDRGLEVEYNVESPSPKSEFLYNV